MHRWFSLSKGILIIASGVTQIPKGYFQSRHDIKEVYFPSSLRKIGDYAFYGDINLRVVHFMDGLEEIGKWGFGHCSIKKAYLPNSLNRLGIFAFYNNSISDLELSNSLEVIPNGCFEYNDLPYIIVLKNIKKIEIHAFDHCITTHVIFMDDKTEYFPYSFNAYAHIRVFSNLSPIIQEKINFLICDKDNNTDVKTEIKTILK